MLAEALSDRASFCRFCGFARDKDTPERSSSLKKITSRAQVSLHVKHFCPIKAQNLTRPIQLAGFGRVESRGKLVF
jgi:IS5 family transposase